MKAALHVHSSEDPIDSKIGYSAEEIIRQAREKSFEILALTHHGQVFDNAEIRTAAEDNNILFLPSIELEIEGGHVLILQADKSAEEIKSFGDLAAYRVKFPESFVVAPHPFYGVKSLGKDLEDYHYLFDGVEHSHFYTKLLNPNDKAKKFAESYDKPFLATSDCHLHDKLEAGYVKISAKEKTPEAIFEALREGNFKNFSEPLSHFEALKTYLRMRKLSKKK